MLHEHHSISIIQNFVVIGSDDEGLVLEDRIISDLAKHSGCDFGI